ncbi:MAG: cytochrome c [Pseudolabrys sp.]|nr:cytochrome c [Pseudolabrys sp.]MDP2294649.1 cytochrome c [Pseudolabrys sp.]
MMIRIVSACALASVLFFTSGSPSLRAQTAPAQVAKERVDLMKGLWRGYYRDMSEAAKGVGDPKAVAVKATEAAAQMKKFGTLFPPGSGREAVPDTRAKPETWTQRADFNGAIDKLVTETVAFGEAAKAGNADAMKAAWPKVAEACGACHGGPPKSGGKFRFEE